MSITHPPLPLTLLAGAILSLGLASCGGGGGNGQEAESASSDVIQGRVIFQEPIAEAEVLARDASGREWKTTTQASGDFKISIPKGELRLPVLIQANGKGIKWDVSTRTSSTSKNELSPALIPESVDPTKGIATSFTIYSAPAQLEAAHVTPVTSLIVESLTGNRAKAAMLNLGREGTTIAAALSYDKVQAASTQVRQALSMLGMPQALLDNPTSTTLTPVNLTSTYQKLVSGNILSAASSFVNAVAENQIDFGCNGEAWGKMADDGQRRPSCLPGQNTAISWQITDFKMLKVSRSTDFDTRASELAGAGGPGGGWKFQSTLVNRDQRIEKLQDKIFAALTTLDAYRNLPSNGGGALIEMASWPMSTWLTLNSRVCKKIFANELSDLTYSYMELKSAMRRSAPTPKLDAAEGLSLDFSSVFGETQSVNRVVPSFFSNGSDKETCPVFEKEKDLMSNLASSYQPTLARPSAQSLADQINKALTDWESIRWTENNGSPPSSRLFAVVAAAGAFGYYSIDLFEDSAYAKLIEHMTTCEVYGSSRSECTSGSATPSTFRARVSAIVSSLSPDVAAGQGDESTEMTLRGISRAVALALVEKYENHFDDYFQSAETFSPIEVQGWVVDAVRSKIERAGTILIPDVSELGTTIRGSSLEYVGNVVFRRNDQITDAVTWPRLLRVVIHPSLVPAIVSCYTNDQACMGRLRRTREFTPTSRTEQLDGGNVRVIPAYIAWQEYIKSVSAHEEVVPYQWNSFGILETEALNDQ